MTRVLAATCFVVGMQVPDVAHARAKQFAIDIAKPIVRRIEAAEKDK